MKILIDLTCLSYHVTGVERYALCITKEMMKMDTTNEYILVFRDDIFGELKDYVDTEKVKAVILHGDKKNKFLLLDLPRALSKISADRYLFLASKSPLLFRKRHIYGTIHDLVCWDYPDTMRILQKIYSRMLNRNAAKVSEKIFTVSEFSKGRIHDILGYPKDKIIVAYSAISDTLKDDTNADFDKIKEKYNLPDCYIMNLSTMEPRKNLELLLKCFDNVSANVEYDIVLVGRKGWKIDEFLQKIESNNRIHITGFIEDKEVVQIYKNAMCFVFPSIYEGFGLPPVEALSLGTPVVASNAASIPEILMDRAVYFKNNSEEELQKLLIDLKNNVKKMPHELNQFQYENYSFKASAIKILEAIAK